MAQLKLWEAVSEIIIRYCQQRPGRQTIDGADGIANEAFFQLLRGMQEKRFKKLADRHDLLEILFQLCKCRTIDSQRRGDAKKRGEGKQTDLDPHQLSEDILKPIVAECFEEILELVAQRYKSGPEVRIFEYAYLAACSDQHITRIGVKDEQGEDMKLRQIQTRRKAMIEWLRDKVSRRE